MYLSRVEIDSLNRYKMKQLDHLGAYHSWVEESFPEEIKDSLRTRKLWRIDRLNNKKYLLIVSESQPTIHQLERFGVQGTAESKDYFSVINRINEGDTFHFRLKLNPVKSLSNGKQSGKRGRVIPLVTASQQLEFLEERSSLNGFTLVDNSYQLIESKTEILKKTKNRPLKIVSATYEGILQVSDLDKFKGALINGIGKKKAYGFGLLTVIPR